MAERITECLIVGAGPAGMSAAIYMARYSRACVIFDAGYGRSTFHQVNHNYLGFPGGVPITALRELGREQLAEYPHVDFESCKVESMERQDGVFVARSQAGTWYGQTVILCTGVLDHYPHFDGWEDYVGRSMFWCITCDGYSSRGKNIIVLGNTDSAAAEALQLSRFTPHLTLLTNSRRSEITPTFHHRLAAAGIDLIHDKIDTAIGDGHGQLVRIVTDGGHEIALDALFSIQGATPDVGLALDLGITLAANGFIETDVEQKTNVPGAYAAGDVTRIHSHQVTTAVHEGATAACAANYYLYPPELKVE